MMYKYFNFIKYLLHYFLFVIMIIYQPARPGAATMMIKGSSQDSPMITAGPTPNNDRRPDARGRPE